MRSKRVLETLYLMLEARTLNRWEFSKSPIVWGDQRNKETIRRVSTNQRVWEQVYEQTQPVPWWKTEHNKRSKENEKETEVFTKRRKKWKGGTELGPEVEKQGSTLEQTTWPPLPRQRADKEKNERPRANLKTKKQKLIQRQQEEWRATCKFKNKKDQDNEKNERPRTKSYLKESLIAVALVASAAGIFFSRNGADFSRSAHSRRWWRRDKLSKSDSARQLLSQLAKIHKLTLA